MKNQFLFLLLLSSITAAAQSDSVQVLQTAEVKAFAQQRKLIDLPAAVAVISPANLNRFSNTSLLPALNSQPGIRMEERSPGSYRMNIRGSSLRAPFGVRNVKVYYNDIPYTTPGGDSYFNQLGFSTVQSLEIIKGPGSSLYGAGTGGVILLQTEPKEFREGFSGGYTAGSYGLQNYQLNLRGGTAGFRNTFNYQDQKNDGYRTQSALKRRVFNWDLKALTSSKSTLAAHFLYSDLEYGAPGGLNKKEFDSIPRAARPRVGATPGAVEAKAKINQQTYLAGIHYTYQFSDRWSEATSLYGAFTRLRNPGLFNYSWTQESHTGGRTQYQYKGAKSSWQFGAELQQGWSSVRTFKNVNGHPDSVRTDDDVNNRSFIVFAQGSMELGQGFSLTGGVSLNQLRTSITRLNSFPVTEKTRQYNNEWAPRIAVLKKLNGHLSVFASVARGFSPPTTSEVLPSSGIIATDLNPEQGWNYELGSRGNFFEGRFSYDINAFYFALNNAIVIRRDNLGRDYFVNAGGTEQKGIETQVNYRLPFSRTASTGSLKFWLSHTWYAFTYKKFTKGTVDYSGKHLPSVPKHNLVFGTDINLNQGVYANITYTYTDPIPLNDANTDRSAAIHLLNIRGGWKKEWKKNWQTDFFINAENLTDTRYSLGFDLNAAGGRYYNTAPGRNYSIGLLVSKG